MSIEQEKNILDYINNVFNKGDSSEFVLENIFKKIDLKTILNEMDNLKIDSIEWKILNILKAIILEEEKPSTKENIITFKEKDLSHIPLGFSNNKDVNLSDLEVFESNRSLLEYNPTYRHPIPYVIVKHKDQFFFILREKGSGEIMLIGKKGMLGGHIGTEDLKDVSGKGIDLFNSCYRELEEEAGITKDMIDKIELKGVIKSNDGVDQYHLGLIYEIEINTLDIKSEEEDVLTGLWIKKENLEKHYNEFESWSKIAYDNIIK